MTEGIRRLITRTSVLTGALAVVLSPVPLADELVFLPVFGVLALRVGKVHGLSQKDMPWRPMVATTIAALAARATVNVAVSFIPGVAAVANAVSAVTVTRMLGQYFDGACAAPADARPLSVREIAASMKVALSGRGRTPAA